MKQLGKEGAETAETPHIHILFPSTHLSRAKTTPSVIGAIKFSTQANTPPAWSSAKLSTRTHVTCICGRLGVAIGRI